MKNRVIYPVLVLTFLLGVARAATITVNTADNTDFGTGKTNLVYALTNINDGDTIAFAIPGAGPHHLITPVGGYSLITRNNLLIDGYTQAGSSRNSNTILAANNAVLKIVLDSQNGEGTSNAGPGFGASETGVLFLMGTNCHVRGFCFLGAGNSSGVNDKAAINIGNTAHDTHVSGCWIGVDVDGTSLHTFDRGPTAFGDVVGGVPSWAIGTVVGVKAGPADTAAARAQQNVIVGGWVNIFLESMNMVIAGNKINVLPDGMHDVDQNVAPLEAVIETGRVNNNMRVGTDGNGLNDAEERNVFGGVTFAGDDNIIEIYSQNGTVGRCTNIVIAGNYFGVAVDGVTRFTNAMLLADRLTRRVSGVDSSIQFGSDLDGTSDDIEANVISMNYPFPDPTTAVLPRFCNLTAEGTFSLRGNKLMNNNLPPFSYADGFGGGLNNFTNYAIPYMDPATNSIIPTLDPASTYPHLKGTFALGTNGFTNIIIDVYQLDQEGWQNGKAVAGAQNWSELTDGASYTNGFAQGSKYLGSRVVPNTGSFDIDISGMDSGLGAVTVTANYSADPPGTHNGRVHTSDFSIPVNLAFIPGGAESVGLTRIVPDTIVWYQTSLGRSKIGGYVAGDQSAEGGSVEATAGVLGDSTFLLAAITRATNDDANMSFTSVLIPAAGGTPRLDNLFYDDSGTIWLKQINLSRQTGNPGRIGGDPRYGAVNYAGAGEVSLFAYPEFNSDGRWSNPFFQDALARACRSYEGQIHRLDPYILASTPLMKAVDTMFGRLWTNTVAPAGGQDFGRTGSSPIGLDNGNFVFVGEDRTTLNNPSGRAAIATIFAPNGSIVKEAFMVNPSPTPDGSMWNSVGAYRGGFFVRPASGIIYFYDNAGNLQGTLNHNAASGLLYDTGRSDGTRMCSDIRSHYIFQAGKAPESASFTNIMLTAYDANTRTWIANTIVSSEGNQDVTSLGSTRLLDRCNVACDAYNRVAVVYRLRPDRVAFTQDQIAARIFSFDGTKFTPLTPTFFPFIEHDADPNNLAGFKSVEPSVAMTTREILFYAKGFWNGTASPTSPVVTLDNTHCYTILRHPAPVAAPRPTLTINKSGANLNLSWNPDDGLFTVQTRSSVTSGTWASATAGNVAPPVSIPAGAGPLYVRLAR